MLFGKRNIKNLSDDQLLKEFYRTEKQLYLAELYQRYLPLVIGTCMKYLKNQVAAQDASMDIYEHCLKKIPGKAIEHFKSWLYVVTKNHCLMHLRKNKNVHFSDVESLEHHLTASNGYDFVKEDQLQKMSAAMVELKPEQQQCIALFYLKNKCYQEIADELNMNLKQVKSHIQNGKRNLKNILSKDEAFNDKIAEEK
ncbi:MAG: sigma-70 family RNA polymerase sigma factor [Bacteroidota bacterium]